MRKYTYHGIDIVRWDGKTITLNTGGWAILAVRRAMNRCSIHHGLDFRVEIGWVVHHEGEKYHFVDNTCTFPCDLPEKPKKVVYL